MVQARITSKIFGDQMSYGAPLQLRVLSDAALNWKAHVTQWSGCTRCEIGKIANHHVFARGVLPCDVLFIGEAPGDTEDVLGFPFVGRAGKLLDEFVGQLHGSYNLNTFAWALANVVLCKPQDGPGQKFREPSEGEKHNCRPRLLEFIASIAKPEAIIYLGRHAQRAGPFKDAEGEEIPSTYIKHPSAILRMGGTESVIGSEVFAAELNRAVTFLNGVFGE